MLLAHARTLCDARSALAMLSDSASSVDASSAYEHVLITLDAIHGNDRPCHRRVRRCPDAATRY